MTDPIGFRLDSDDDDEATNVGVGCAEFTPVDDEAGHLRNAIGAIRKLRRMGAVRVRIGELEAVFPGGEAGQE